MRRIEVEVGDINNKHRKVFASSSKFVTEVRQGENTRNKKIIKKFLVLLSLVITIITIYQITNIYAVFYSEWTGTFDREIAKWKIIINNIDIVKETVQTFEVEFISEDSSAADGKFLPGMEGNFEIIIEPKTTQVSVRYDITIDDTDFLDTDINLIGVIETEENNTIIRTDENTYTGIIPLASISSNNNYFDNVKIIFKWEVDENAGEQGIIVKQNGELTIKVPISVKVTQYLGEEIIPYI